MSVPKKRRTASSAKKRRSHNALKKKNLSACPKCKKPVVSYRACGFCGYYKGREVVKIKVKKGEKQQKEKKSKS